MTRVEVPASVLKWAVDRSGLPVGSLREKFPKLPEWMTGHRQPTLRQLEEFATATRTPLGFLFLQQPPVEPLPVTNYRTPGSLPVGRPSPDLLDTIYAMQRRQAWMRDYLTEIGQPPVPFVGSSKLSDSVERVANRIRNALGMAPDWTSHHRSIEDAQRALRNSMDAKGILVVMNGIVGQNTSRCLDPDEFRGFVLVDDLAPLVFVNNADAQSAKMFTLAHELAHVFFGRSAAFDLSRTEPAADALEQRCNAVAAELLVPAEEVRRVWDSATGAERADYDGLAKVFKVSAVVVARRLADLGFVTRPAFHRFYAVRTSAERSAASSGGLFYNNLETRIGRTFGNAVVQSVRGGRTTYTEAYALTDLRGETFDHFAADFGG